MSGDGLLVLSRADVARLMGYADYVDAIEAAFRLAADGRAVAPSAAALHVPGRSFHAKGAALLGDSAVVAIKLNGNFPDNPARCGPPTVQGVIYFADAANGQPLASMDSIEITINRTGAATTLAARHLARPDSWVATICGAGARGRIQARAERVKESGMVVPPALGSGHVVNFPPTGDGKAAVTGDFVLQADEVSLVQRELISHGIEVTALHSHLLKEEPRLYFIHFSANADTATLARAIRQVVDRTRLKRG